jgi:acetylornithine deacetylase/succinyl-diaminopimelate desuccinylase-like protein
MTNFAHGANEIGEVLSHIHGAALEQDIIELASIGGRQIDPTPELPVRFASNRLALSEADAEGREHAQTLMEQAGMRVDIGHPLALVGTHEGSDPDLAPIDIISHIDTVPNGDMYDGVLGVLGGVAVVKALNASGVTLRRTVRVLSLTGEESSRV